MEPEVLIFGGTLLHECREILRQMIPDIRLSCISEKQSNDFILICKGECWCVFDSSQHPVIELAQQKRYKTLTCGFSYYDTLVLSSSSSEQAVVSLQREIVTVSGQIREPGDYLIHKHNNYSDMAVLLSAAVLLLLDRKGNEFYF